MATKLTTTTKRGPGRPPKAKPQDQEQHVKRGPGRPPKAKQVEQPVKRGRGRPPKA